MYVGRHVFRQMKQFCFYYLRALTEGRGEQGRHRFVPAECAVYACTYRGARGTGWKHGDQRRAGKETRQKTVADHLTRCICRDSQTPSFSPSRCLGRPGRRVIWGGVRRRGIGRCSPRSRWMLSSVWFVRFSRVYTDLPYRVANVPSPAAASTPEFLVDKWECWDDLVKRAHAHTAYAHTHTYTRTHTHTLTHPRVVLSRPEAWFLFLVFSFPVDWTAHTSDFQTAAQTLTLLVSLPDFCSSL